MFGYLKDMLDVALDVELHVTRKIGLDKCHCRNSSDWIVSGLFVVLHYSFEKWKKYVDSIMIN